MLQPDDSPGPPAVVLFDMDGTLVQSREAVWRIFAPINQEFELGIEGAEDFFEIFTQNLFDGMRSRCGDAELAQRVIDEFFQRLKERYRPEFVPGMAEVVSALAGTTTLAVVTTNVMEVVRQVLVEHNVATCFAHVFSGDVEPSKSRVISHLKTNAAYTLARHCSPHYDEAEETGPPGDGGLIMVTDTVGDIRAAKSEGIGAVGVAWGMHSEERLREAGADAVALWPQELLALLSNDARLTCEVGACAVGGPATGPSNAVLDRVRAAHERHRARLGARRLGGVPDTEQGPQRIDVDAQLAQAVRRILPAGRP